MPFNPCVQERCCSWTTTLRSRQPLEWAHQAKPWAAAPEQVAPRLPLLSCICPHLVSHLGPVAAQGSRGEPWAPLRTHPSMNSHSCGGLPLRARQKSSAAPATARVAWWPDRDSEAKMQPLQLLWLNHLLNYAGKRAWNHNLHWFSSPLPETRGNWARGNHSSQQILPICTSLIRTWGHLVTGNQRLFLKQRQS